MLSYTLIAGLLFGLYFTLVGLGLNLVFGVMRIVNLAHGDFLMLGAFLAYWLYTLFAINPLPAVPIAFAAFLLVGLPLYRLLVPRLLRARDPEMLSFILFFGLSQAIEAVATIAFGTSERSIPGRVIGESIASALSRCRATRSAPGRWRSSASAFRWPGRSARASARWRWCWSTSTSTGHGSAR